MSVIKTPPKIPSDANTTAGPDAPEDAPIADDPRVARKYSGETLTPEQAAKEMERFARGRENQLPKLPSITGGEDTDGPDAPPAISKRPSITPTGKVPGS